MAEYEEFRIELSPNLQNAGSWDVTLAKCPVPGLAGPQGTVAPAFTRKQLRRLRNRNNWPSLAELQKIGEDVWASIMNPGVNAAFLASRAFLKDKGIRITVVMLGQENERAPGDGVRLSELPVEALYADALQFLATDVNTPISRSLQFDPTHAPHDIILPLRVLVVVAAPSDKPPADAAAEAQAIRDALAAMSGPGGSVELDFCEPPTREELKKRVARYHILHFIGHGGFDSIGNDATQRSFICMVRPDNGKSDPLDANDLTGILRNTEVRLVVLTSCSSALPTPEEEPYPIGAFEGLAQRVLTGASNVSAVVAMQFDMESEAAVSFTRVFYENLLRPDRSLDETVTLARNHLSTDGHFGSGHRAWVTPTVYWRCEGGKVFNIDTFSGGMTEETREKIIDLQGRIASYMHMLSDIAREPAEVRNMLQSLRDSWLKQVEELQHQRGQLLGDSMRLRGGVVKPGDEFACRLAFRVRLKGSINLVRVSVTFPANKLQFVGAAPGQNTPGNNPLVGNTAPGVLEVAVLNPSAGGEWTPDEYEVGVLRFRMTAGLQPHILDLNLNVLEIRRDGKLLTSVKPLDAVVFVDA
jgi:hypothetical protein